jgi:hypothetical protein
VITAPKVEGNTSMPISLGHLERAMGNEGSDIWQHSAQEYFDCVASFDAAVRKSQDPCAIKLPGCKSCPNCTCLSFHHGRNAVLTTAQRHRRNAA